jgi:hypothetical protein
VIMSGILILYKSRAAGTSRGHCHILATLCSQVSHPLGLASSSGLSSHSGYPPQQGKLIVRVPCSQTSYPDPTSRLPYS